MFRRKATLGTQSLLGNKDRKRLREQALKAFPRLTEEQFDLLLPSKEELSVAKLQLSVHLTTTSSGSSNSSSSSAGASSSSKKSSSSSSSLLPPVLNPTGSNRGVVYISRSEPIFFEVNGLLSPSVYALWRVPEILPSFVIHSPVSSFILRGADLMLPGILLPLTIRCEEKFGAKTNRSDTRGPALPIELQELWSIRVVGNRYPFAVGRSVVSAGSLHHLGGKGKAVEILHHFADGLWQIGPETSPNSSFTLKEILGGEEEEDDFDTPAESVRPQADLPSSPSSFQGRLAPCLQSRSSIGSHGKVDTSGAAEDADAEDDGWGIGKERKEEEERERRGEEGVDRRDNYRDDGGRSVKEERQDGGGEQEEEGERDEDSDRAEKRHSDEDRGEGEEEEDDERDLNDRKGNEEKNKEQLLRLQQQEEEEEAPQQQEAPGVPSLSTEAMDDYLYFCALEILHALSDEQLPMDISALNSKISSDASAVYFEKLKIPEKPSQFIPPDLRKSSHKKLTKFVQSLSKKKLLQTKECRGVVSLIKIDRSHPEYKAYSPIPDKTKKKIQEKVALLSSQASSSSPSGRGIEGENTHPSHGGAPSLSSSSIGDETGRRGRFQGQGQSPSSSSLGPMVIELYTPPQKCLRIFQAVKVKTGKDLFFTGREMKDVLTAYLKMLDEEEEKKKKEEDKGGESNKREDGGEEEEDEERRRGGGGQLGGRSRRDARDVVALDTPLKEALLTKEELQACQGSRDRRTKDKERGREEEEERRKALGGEKEEEIKRMTKEEIFTRWQSTWLPCYAVLPPSQQQQEIDLSNLKIHKGSWEPVIISVEDRHGGRKHSTQILGLQTFLLDPKVVAEYLQKKLAASASVCTLPGQKDIQAVSIQGSNASGVAEILVSHFHLHRKYVSIVNAKQKKSTKHT